MCFDSSLRRSEFVRSLLVEVSTHNKAKYLALSRRQPGKALAELFQANMMHVCSVIALQGSFNCLE